MADRLTYADAGTLMRDLYGLDGTLPAAPPARDPDRDLVNIVFNSTPHEMRASGSRQGPSQAPTLTPRQVRDRLRYSQHSSQARACGSRIRGPVTLASYHGATGQAYAVTGWESSCGSPNCFKCRIALMSERQLEIQHLIDRWREQGPLHQVSMLTLTVRHHAHHSIDFLLGDTDERTGIRGAVALLKQRKAWRRLVDAYVCGFDATDGDNSAHLHYHVLIFHKGQLRQDDYLRSWTTPAGETREVWTNRELALAWIQAVSDAGLPAPDYEFCCTVQPAESAAAYMAKWSVISEVTGSHYKQAKGGNHTLAELETRAAGGCMKSYLRLTRYHRAMVRVRWHTFSQKLKDWREEHEQARELARPLLVFDPASSDQLADSCELRQLVVQLAGETPTFIQDVPDSLGLVGSPIADPQNWRLQGHRAAAADARRFFREGRDAEATEATDRWFASVLTRYKRAFNQAIKKGDPKAMARAQKSYKEALERFEL